jgi:hypothetical protein
MAKPFIRQGSLLGLLLSFVISWLPRSSSSNQDKPGTIRTLASRSLTAPLGDVFEDQIGTIVSCNGLTIGSFWSSVNWGDNSLSSGEFVAPWYQGILRASHIFTTPNTYTVPINTTEKCVNMDAYGNGSTTNDAVAGSVTITVNLAAAPSALSLSAASVSGGTPVTATITIAGSSADTRVWLGVSNPSVASVQPVYLVINAGQTSGTATIATTTPSPSPQIITVNAVSGGVSVSAALKVT